MGFFDFLDSRKSLAKWAAKIFTQARHQNPQISDNEIIDIAIHTRYSIVRLKPHQTEILHSLRDTASDIFSLCYLIAEVELLSHLDAYHRMTLQMGGENIVDHTFNVIGKELAKLGFQR